MIHMTAIPRTTTFVAGAAALAAGAAFLFSGSASADPQEQDGSPLVNTTCSVDQIDAATQKEAPKFWERMSSDPDKLQKAHERLQEFLDKSPEERQAAVDEFTSHAKDRSADHSGKEKWTKEHEKEVQDTMDRVFSTCEQY
jgi:cellobiose-specific phosphotransferase system component IIA